MTVYVKARAVVLIGLAVAVSLPLEPAFGEGGARRDVVRHAAEANAATIETLYLVEFEANDAGSQLTREQTIERLDKLVIPTLESLGKNGKIRAGGAVGTLAGTFVVGAKSKEEVSELVRALPASGLLQWNVRQLETFVYRAELERKTLQGLRSQK